MATAEQIKSLIRSFGEENRERFFTVALQVAAQEAKQGHTALANEIRDLVDKEKKVSHFPRKTHALPEINSLIQTENDSRFFSSIVLAPELKERISRILSEYKQRGKLKRHGLSHRRKVLLVGPPGTGKTLTAKIIAHELRLPLHIVQIDRLVTKFMGETGAKLRVIFDLMENEHGVYFFDEFDAIGGNRESTNDVGEMRRVLNAFLQFIEQDRSDSLIIAATNNPKLLDNALFRRFDDVLYYQLPTKDERKHLIKNILGEFVGKRFPWLKTLNASDSLSHAELDLACRDAIKIAILTDSKSIDPNELLDSIQQRLTSYSR